MFNSFSDVTHYNVLYCKPIVVCLLNVVDKEPSANSLYLKVRRNSNYQAKEININTVITVDLNDIWSILVTDQCRKTSVWVLKRENLTFSKVINIPSRDLLVGVHYCLLCRQSIFIQLGEVPFTCVCVCSFRCSQQASVLGGFEAAPHCQRGPERSAPQNTRVIRRDTGASLRAGRFWGLLRSRFCCWFLSVVCCTVQSPTSYHIYISLISVKGACSGTGRM